MRNEKNMKVEKLDDALNRLTNLKRSEIESIDIQIDEVTFGKMSIKGLKISLAGLTIISVLLSVISLIFYYLAWFGRLQA